MFGRRTAESPGTDDASSSVVRDEPGGKGRPTPSRREAEAARKAQLKPPTDRKEAARRQREERAKARHALLEGDERAMPAKDRGPLRRFARDYVDARLNTGELFLPGAFAILILGLVKNPQVQRLSLVLWFALIVTIAVDTIILSTGLKRRARTLFPDESTKGLTFYAVMRGLQIRRLRVPKPRVRRGGRPIAEGGKGSGGKDSSSKGSTPKR